MPDSRLHPCCRPGLALAIATVCGGVTATAANRIGEPASALSAAPGAAVSAIRTTRSPADLEGVISLSRLLGKIGRDPDRSEDGGACGGIVIHDWVDENLRVITQGDQVQSIGPLNPEPD